MHQKNPRRHIKKWYVCTKYTSLLPGEHSSCAVIHQVEQRHRATLMYWIWTKQLSADICISILHAHVDIHISISPAQENIWWHLWEQKTNQAHRLAVETTQTVYFPRNQTTEWEHSKPVMAWSKQVTRREWVMSSTRTTKTHASHDLVEINGDRMLSNASFYAISHVHHLESTIDVSTRHKIRARPIFFYIFLIQARQAARKQNKWTKSTHHQALLKIRRFEKINWTHIINT